MCRIKFDRSSFKFFVYSTDEEPRLSCALDANSGVRHYIDFVASQCEAISLHNAVVLIFYGLVHMKPFVDECMVS